MVQISADFEKVGIMRQRNEKEAASVLSVGKCQHGVGIQNRELRNNARKKKQ